MNWAVAFDPAFDAEFETLAVGVQDEILARAKVLEAFGPFLGRPNVDTLKGSRHANMKELRFTADDGVWRVAFAFDPGRRPFCSWPVTSPVSVKGASTGG